MPENHYPAPSTAMRESLTPIPRMLDEDGEMPTSRIGPKAYLPGTSLLSWVISGPALNRQAVQLVCSMDMAKTRPIWAGKEL